MEGMRRYFPNAPLTDDVAEEYAGEWIEIARKYGIERFEEAAVLARRYKLLDGGETVARQFFPLPGEIEEFIVKRTQPLMRAVTVLDCRDCSGTGWERVKFVADGDGAVGVKRCHCRKLVRR